MRLTDDYFHWLLGQVDGERYDENVMWELYSKPFYWLLDMDSNRATDALELRRTYFRDVVEESMGKEAKYDPGASTCDIQVLEMMVALAIRMEEDIMWTGGESRVPLWFYHMVHSLGVDALDNRFISDVRDIMDIWLNREFDYNGNGSIFGLGEDPKYDYGDQRDTEIWYQMQNFLSEFYNDDF